MKHITDIDFRGRKYRVEEWTGKEDEIPVVPLVAIDTETELIVDAQTPNPVLMQVSFPSLKKVHIVHWKRIEEYVSFFLAKNPEAKLAFHNCGFDLDVLNWRNNKDLMVKVSKGDVLDTGVRYYLKALEDGTALDNYPKLSQVVKRLFNLKLEKDDSIRKTFTQDMVLTDAHLEYAALDAIATGEIIKAVPRKYPTESLQVTAVITCNAMQQNGMYVDMECFHQLKRKFEKQEVGLLRTLEVFGYVPGMKGNDTVKQEVLRSVEKRCDVKFERTKTGKIATSEEKIMGIDAPHPFLDAYKEYVHLHKMISTYLNEDLIGTDGRVHPHFNPLVRSGRTSCSKPNIFFPFCSKLVCSSHLCTYINFNSTKKQGDYI